MHAYLSKRKGKIHVYNCLQLKTYSRIIYTVKKNALGVITSPEFPDTACHVQHTSQRSCWSFVVLLSPKLVILIPWALLRIYIIMKWFKSPRHPAGPSRLVFQLFLYLTSGGLVPSPGAMLPLPGLPTSGSQLQALSGHESLRRPPSDSSAVRRDAASRCRTFAIHREAAGGRMHRHPSRGRPPPPLRGGRADWRHRPLGVCAVLLAGRPVVVVAGRRVTVLAGRIAASPVGRWAVVNAPRSPVQRWPLQQLPQRSEEVGGPRWQKLLPSYRLARRLKERYFPSFPLFLLTMSSHMSRPEIPE